MKPARSKLLVAWFAAGILESLLVGAPISAQTEIVDFLEGIRNAEVQPAVPVADSVLKRDPLGSLALVASYSGDVSPEVRAFAAGLAARTGWLSADPSARRQAVDLLIRAAGDKDLLVLQRARRDLLTFRSEDFSKAAQESLRTWLKESDPDPLVVRAVGVAGMREELARLLELASTNSADAEPEVGRWWGTSGWAAELVLARLGRQEHLLGALQRVEREKDDVARVTLLLRDLAFTRQTVALRHVGIYLRSEARLPGLKVGQPGMPFSQYAIDALAEHAEGFPIVRRNPGAYREEDLKSARVWVEAL